MMEWIMELVSEVLLACLWAVLTFLASKLGLLLGRFFREKLRDESIREVAFTCVHAVQQMYRDRSGAEKLEKALLMGERMLAQKGLSISAAELRVVLEAALAEAKGAFEEK